MVASPTASPPKDEEDSSTNNIEGLKTPTSDTSTQMEDNGRKKERSSDPETSAETTTVASPEQNATTIMDQQRQQQQQPSEQATESSAPQSQNTSLQPSRQATRTSTPRSMVSSIVVRQTEETLQALQINFQIASKELLRTLGNHLSGLPSSSSVRGTTIAASAIGWLATQIVENESPSDPSRHGGLATATTATTEATTASNPFSHVRELLPRLTHLRITPDPWPKKSSLVTATQRQPLEISVNNNNNNTVQQCHHNLQYFHRLRYSPRVDVSIFPRLQVLLLDQVPPDWVINLSCLKATLQMLRVERACLYDLTFFLLGSEEEETAEPTEFEQLTHLKLSRCNLGEMTRGLALSRETEREPNSSNTTNSLPLAKMPKLSSLSLAHNDIRSEKTALGCGISNSSVLSTIDLSYNQIPSLIKAPLYLGNIQTLLLTGNRIKSAAGVDRLFALETLALDDNKIKSWMDIAGLARLPELKILKLKGNPLMETSSKNRKYARVMLLDMFREQRWGSLGDNAATFRQLESILPVIDGKIASSRELKALQQRAFVTVSTPAARTSLSSRHTTKAGSNGIVTATDTDIHHTTEGPLVAAGKLAATSSQLFQSAGRQKMKRARRKVARAVIDEDLGSFTLCSAATSTRLVPKQVSSKNGKKQKGRAKKPSPNNSDEDSEELCEQDTTGNNSSASDVLAPPTLSFSINDVLLSLKPTTATATLSVASKEEELAGEAPVGDKPQGPRAEKERSSLDEHSSRVNVNAGQDSPAPEFEWPQPLRYLPEQNLYDEFEWNPPATISLSGGTKHKTKQKRQKEKKGLPKKLHQIAPPSITTTSANETALDISSSQRSTRVATSSNRSAVAKTSISPKAKSNRDAYLPAADGSVGSLSRKSNIARKGEDENEAGVKTGNGALDSSLASDVSSKQIAAEDGNGSLRSFHLRAVSFEDGENIVGARNSVSGAAFPAMAMEAGGADDITCSSIGTNTSGVGSKKGSKKGQHSKNNIFYLAESKSKFVGLEQQRQLKVMENLELYFQTFVFPKFMPGIGSNIESDTWQSVFFRYPRIQLLQKDRDLRDTKATTGGSVQLQSQVVESDYEQFVRVWREDVVAVGKPSLRRLQPNRTAHFGFHGELSWVDGKVKTVSECRQVIICLSNTSFYVILDNDSLTAKDQSTAPATAAAAAAGTILPGTDNSTVASHRSSNSIEVSPRAPNTRRKYPSPMSPDAVFEEALWPHAVACHPLKDILGITIGFGFQRMTLRVRNSAYPSAVDFSYVMLTSNKLRTVQLLQELQSLVKEVKLEIGRATLTEEAIKIDNDDKQFLDGLAVAVAPEPLGAVLHYQILKQRWKHGQRGAVSRICVVGDSKIFLLDEAYCGDGSVSVEATSGQRLGAPTFRLVDSANLEQVVEVQAADADPNAITIVISPAQTMSRTHRWRLLCRDSTGAEKLVEDVRKAKGNLTEYL